MGLKFVSSKEIAKCNEISKIKKLSWIWRSIYQVPKNQCSVYVFPTNLRMQ